MFGSTSHGACISGGGAEPWVPTRDEMMAMITEVVTKAVDAAVTKAVDAAVTKAVNAAVTKAVDAAVDAAVEKAMRPVLVRLDALERRMIPRLVHTSCATEALMGMRIRGL